LSTANLETLYLYLIYQQLILLTALNIVTFPDFARDKKEIDKK